MNHKFWVVGVLVLIGQTALCQSLETVIQKGHELAVLAIAIHPDSNYVATGSRDKSAKIWETHSGREVRSFLGHEASVTCLEFSADGILLLTGSNDRTLRLWEVRSGKELQSIVTPDYIRAVAIDPQQRFFMYAGYADSSDGDSAMVFDYKTRKILRKISVSPDMGNGSGVDIAISPDGKFLALGEDNRVANLYETSTWKHLKSLGLPEGFCGGCGTQVVFSPDSKFLYVASNNGPHRKYDLGTYKLIREYQKEIDDLNDLTVSHDGLQLAMSTDKTIKIWNESTGAVIDSLVADEGGDFHQVSFAANNKQLFVASDNNTAFFWKIKPSRKSVAFTGFLNQRDKGGINYDPNSYWQSNIAKYLRFKNSLLISNDGKSLIKGRFGAKVKRWDIATGKSVMEYVGHKKGVISYDLSKDGKRLLTGGGDGKIMLWNMETGDSLQSIQSYRVPIFDIHFNSTESESVSSSWDGTMKLHNLETGKLISYIDLENSSAYNLVFHPNDLYIFTARLDNSLQLWEIDTKQVVRNFVGHTDIISSIHLSDDQKTVLSSSWDGSIRLWDVGTGLMTKKFKSHRGAVHTAIFGNDNRSVYSGGADRLIRVWDIQSSTVTRTFEGHRAEITSLLLSPDSKMLISHSVDGVTKFWDLSSGREFFEHIHLGEKDWMVKNPDGYFNATDGARQYIHFVEGLKTYSVDQFFNEFYRPDLLPKIFQNRGGSDDSKGIPGKLKNSPPPTLKIALVRGTENKAEVYVQITDNGNGADNLRLLHNGKNISLQKDGLKYPNSKGQSTTYKQWIDLIGGLNTFSAVASNKEKVESDPQTIELVSDHASKSSTCYLLAVGINQYKNSKMNLNYAKPDAESFTGVIDQNSSLFKKIEVHTLYDTDASRANLMSLLDELAGKVSQEDVFIFYYAGHGSMVDDKFYFIPSESSRLYDAGSLNKEAIEASLLQEKFSRIHALKQLIIMDACQSGGSVELLATRGATEEKAIAQLSRSAGIHVMASAGSEQFATEFAELGHGLFTYVLLKALQGEADGSPKDGKVTIYELKSYIDDQVPEMTRKLKGKPQYPYTFSRGQDFPVIIDKD